MEHFILASICIMGLFLMFRLMSAPIRMIWKCTINLVCGFAALILINVLGGFLGISLGINFLSVLIIGLLGLPGVGLLLILGIVI